MYYKGASNHFIYFLFLSLVYSNEFNRYMCACLCNDALLMNQNNEN